MKNIRVISNCATAISDELREAVRAAREAGYEVEVRVAWEQEDGALFAREAADAGCERIIVCGGDGTWSAAARGVFGSSRRLEVRLGLVPCGTGNDFARMFKLDTWGLPEAVAVAARLGAGDAAGHDPGAPRGARRGGGGGRVRQRGDGRLRGRGDAGDAGVAQALARRGGLRRHGAAQDVPGPGPPDAGRGERAGADGGPPAGALRGERSVRGRRV
ncbi:MAG: hypothetical protein CMH57_03445 [Myxococcales bacterium]|nr:hypothetical protein [Myxococcales bacterium]